MIGYSLLEICFRRKLIDTIKSELLKRALEDISKMLSDLIKYGASLEETAILEDLI